MKRPFYASGLAHYPQGSGFFIYRRVNPLGILIYDKPFKTFDEQIDILENKYNLFIENREMALTALQSLTYYDLINGYKDVFLVNDKFEPGVSIGFLHMFTQIDKHIQSTIFKYSTIVENSYKSKLAYIIAKNFGVCEHDYLDESHYFKSNNKITFKAVKRACTSIYDGSKPIPLPTQHYVKKHNHIPPWILFKNLSFSNAINLFQLLKPNEKKELADLIIPGENIDYYQKVEFIIASLNIVRSFRNKIAHNLKFITYKNTFHSLEPKTVLKILPPGLLHWKDIKKRKIGLNDIYADILCILILLNDDYLAVSMLYELTVSFHKMNTGKSSPMQMIKSKYFEITKLPPDIEARFTALYQQKAAKLKL